MNMVGMFMGNDDGIQLIWRYAEQRQAPLGLPQGKATIDQHTGVVTGDQRTIALATAS